MLITHKQSLIMLSITCRCILYALVSVVVPWGVALGWVRMRLGGEKSTVYSLQKARLHHCLPRLSHLHRRRPKPPEVQEEIQLLTLGSKNEHISIFIRILTKQSPRHSIRLCLLFSNVFPQTRFISNVTQALSCHHSSRDFSRPWEELW